MWDKHWARLVRDSAKIGIDLFGQTSDSLLDRLTETIAEDSILGGRARITVFDESASDIWSGGAKTDSKVEIITAGARTVSSEFAVTLSPFSVNPLSPLAGIKSCNYLENILTKKDAFKRGFDEAVRPNTEGIITSGTMSNVFWLKDGMLHTPPLSTGCLPGTTREYILEKIDCRESVIGVDELKTADALFLTSAGLGVVQVIHFDDITYATTSHPVLSALK